MTQPTYLQSPKPSEGARLFALRLHLCWALAKIPQLQGTMMRGMVFDEPEFAITTPVVYPVTFLSDSVDGRNPANQLRLIVYTIIYMVWNISGG